MQKNAQNAKQIVFSFLNVKKRRYMIETHIPPINKIS